MTSSDSPVGQKVPDSTARYLPFGDWRVEPAHDLTDQAFTGQKHNMDLGLYYYNARFYLPGLGRFASADVIVPDPMNPQQFNRYTYTLNNPLRFTDPTGHYCYDPSFGDAAGQCYTHNGYLINNGSSKRPNRLMERSTTGLYDPSRMAPDPLDALWEIVMEMYYDPSLAWLPMASDLGGGALSTGAGSIAEVIRVDPSGSEFFGAAGKAFDVLSFGIDGLKYGGQLEAIYKAWRDPELSITLQELHYLNRRAARELIFSAGLTGASVLSGGTPAVVISATEFGWNMYAHAGENRLGPSGFVAKGYATQMASWPYTRPVREIEVLAGMMTGLMVIADQ